MIRLVLLDRDGVINRDSPDYIKSVAEFVPLAGALEAIVRLTRAGLQVGVCTNQSAIARGLISEADLEAIFAVLAQSLTALGSGLAGIAWCPHLPEDGCDCRKPCPGMLNRLMAELGVPPAETVFVGDSLKDLEAARAAGCRAVLVRTGNGSMTEAGLDEPGAIEVYDDLSAFADALLQAQHGDTGVQH